MEEREIFGDCEGLKKSDRSFLLSLYGRDITGDFILDEALSNDIIDYTNRSKREVALYINRHRRIIKVAIGDFRTVGLTDASRRRSEKSLSAVSCLHTHPGGDCSLSDVDINALRELRFDVIIAISRDVTGVCEASLAYISGWQTGEQPQVTSSGPIAVSELAGIDFRQLINQIERDLQWTRDHSEQSLQNIERAILVGLDRSNSWPIEESLNELAELAITAGAEVSGSVWQKRDKPDSSFYVGRGKMEEINLIRQSTGANVVICDDELVPSQQRNLETALGCKVLDRTALILDIFAARARSHEGKLQVSLAQLKYTLPRIVGQGMVLSRLGGGIGTRGPGETKLEVDRRRIRKRISELEREIRQIGQRRNRQREDRQRVNLPTVAIVGYTNAGKSTLLNRLTTADVFVEDKLFATLDPTTRQLNLPSGSKALLTDTVGFIHKLPHQLIAAFKATLEETIQADLLLQVVDVSHPLYNEHCLAVTSVLQDIGAEKKPQIIAYNKIDRLLERDSLNRLTRSIDSVAISALTGEGIDDLLAILEHCCRKQSIECELLIPYSESSVSAWLHSQGVIVSESFTEEGISIRAMLNTMQRGKLSQYVSPAIIENITGQK